MKNQAQQIPMEWGARSAQGREDFILSPANADAAAWIDRWPNWHAPTLILCGPAACGKTHLAHVWAQKTQACFLRPDLLRAPDASADIINHHVVVDGIDPWIGDRDFETNLFHIYNVCREQGRNILLTMRMPPSKAPFVLADLASRLRAAPLAEIQPPDDDLLGILLVKLFHDRQIMSDPEWIRYLLPRMERSFAAARALVDTADRTALAQKRPVTLALLRDVLAKDNS